MRAGPLKHKLGWENRRCDVGALSGVAQRNPNSTQILREHCYPCDRKTGPFDKAHGCT